MQSTLLRILLLPVSMLYGFISGIRNLLFDMQLFRSIEFKIPVICVGNISVGGTGKTPHAAYLVELLRNEFKVAILSRGYKRITRGFQITTSQSTVFDVGDEPRLYKQKYPEISVAVDGNRQRGISKLLEIEKDLDVIILDDGYQHRWVKPGFSILLVDFNRMITKDYYLPSGRLRESSSGSKRAHAIIITKCPESLKPIERRIAIKDLNPLINQHIYFTTFSYGNLVPVFTDSANETTAEDLKKLDPGILLVTGIANPRMLERHLRGITTRIVVRKYPDHYSFRRKDIDVITEAFKSMEGGPNFIVTTEKDAMRLQFFPEIDPAVKSRLYYIPVNIKFLDNEEANFNKQILSYVGNNKPNRFIHTN